MSTEPAARDPRQDLLDAIDATYAYGVLGYDSPEALLAAFEAAAVSVPPADQTTDRAALRQRIAEAVREAACPGDCGKTEEECAKERIQPFAWHHGRLAVVEGEPEMFADAVLAVLPEPTDRAAEAHRLALSEALDLGTGAPWDAIHERVQDLRRLAAEAQQQPDTETPALPEGEPTESVIYEVVGDWGVDSADSAEGARAAVAKWLRAYPKCGAYAQQRIVREWPDGSEFYGPWTDLPDEQPAAGARQDGAQPKPTAYGDGNGRTFCLKCAPTVGADVPLTANDVDHWELCPSCGRHVIDVASSTEETGRG